MMKENKENEFILTEEQKELVENNINLLYHYYSLLLKTDRVPPKYKSSLLSDLHQSLCTSAVRYDRKRGYKFSTYAYNGFTFTWKTFLRKIGEQEEIPLGTLNDFSFFHELDKEGILWNSVNGWDYNEFISYSEIQEIIDTILLSSREKMILNYYFYENHTYKEVGKEIGMTKQGAHITLQRILNKIRYHFAKYDYKIEDFLTYPPNKFGGFF